MKIEIDETQLLGEGAFGQVFVGRLFSQEIAAKRSQSGSHLPLEAHLLSLCNHTNVVKSHGLVKVRTVTYLIMELAEEGALQYHMGRSSFSQEQQQSLVQQMCNGLDHIHSKLIVHKDIHLGNMLMKSLNPPHLVIADFGEAQFYHESKFRRSFHNIVADQPYTYKSDVYLLALVTRQLFKDSVSMDLEEPVWDVEIFRKLRWLETVKRALNRNPDKRPTAAEFGFAFC